MLHWIRAFILITLFPIAGGTQEASEWKTFTSAPGRFSVRVPGVPDEDPPAKGTENAPTSSHSYTLAYKDVAYILTYTDYPAGQIAKLSPAKLMTDARDRGLNNVKGKLITESEIKVSGYPGRDVIASFPLDGKIGSAHFRIAIANTRLYMMLFVGPGGSAGKSDVDTFLRSFQILAPEPQDGWKTFTSAEGTYTIRLPSKPSEDTTDLAGGGKINRLALDKGAYAYIVSSNAIQGGAPSASAIPTLLNRGRDGIVSALKGKLADDKDITLRGNSGKAFRVSIPEPASTAYVRAYVVGDHYYQLMFIGENKTLEAANFDRFLDSFQLKSRAPSSEWASFSPAEGRFTVELPGTPEKESLANDTTKYTVEAGSSTYIIVFVDLHDEVSDPDKVTAVLEAGKDAELKALSAKLLSEKRVMLGDISGLQTNISIPASKVPGGGYGIERFYLIGKRLYEVAVITSDKSAEESTFARFFDSFKTKMP